MADVIGVIVYNTVYRYDGRECDSLPSLCDSLPSLCVNVLFITLFTGTMVGM